VSINLIVGGVNLTGGGVRDCPVFFVFLFIFLSLLNLIVWFIFLFGDRSFRVENCFKIRICKILSKSGM